MFQSLKRAKYIAQNNFNHWNTQDAVRMHLWLQKNRWPANDFVDWFMRVYPQSNESSNLTFKLFLTSQFDWVHDDDIESLKWLYERILKSNFQHQDKNNLTDWLKAIHEGATSR